MAVLILCLHAPTTNHHTAELLLSPQLLLNAMAALACRHLIVCVFAAVAEVKLLIKSNVWRVSLAK